MSGPGFGGRGGGVGGWGGGPLAYGATTRGRWVHVHKYTEQDEFMGHNGGVVT
jgi:hypothetical protein